MKMFILGTVAGAMLLAGAVAVIYWPEIMGEDYMNRRGRGMG